MKSNERRCGARLWFEGIVRADHPDLKGLDYSAYEAMARKECEAIVRQAKAQWPLHSAVIRHRTGRVAVGETSLLVLVEAPHRQEAFEALQYMIDELKKRVPIWKKEIYEDKKKKAGGHSDRRAESTIWAG